MDEIAKQISYVITDASRRSIRYVAM